MNDNENLNTSLIDEFSIPISRKCRLSLEFYNKK